MKRFIITFVLVYAILVAGLTGYLVFTNTLKPAENQTNIEENNYALTTKVVMIDYPTDVVWCEDFNGNVWELCGCEDWAVGDIASLLMNDKGTENIEDDEIISARYNGTFEGWR